MALREEVPREFTDDARWYRFFTNTMMAAIAIVIFCGLILYKILSLFHLGVVAIIVTITALVLVLALLCLPVPKGDLLGGGGLNLGKVLIRTYIMKKKHRGIYIKGYRGGEKDASVD